MKMIQLEFPFVRPAAEQILEQFKKWLVEEEDGTLSRGIAYEEDQEHIKAQRAYARNNAFEDARLKLTELGVEFD